MIKASLSSSATSNAGSLATSGLDGEGWPRWMREAFAIQPEDTAPATAVAPARVDAASVRRRTRASRTSAQLNRKRLALLFSTWLVAYRKGTIRSACGHRDVLRGRTNLIAIGAKQTSSPVARCRRVYRYAASFLAARIPGRLSQSGSTNLQAARAYHPTPAQRLPNTAGLVFTARQPKK